MHDRRKQHLAIAMLATVAIASGPLAAAAVPAVAARTGGRPAATAPLPVSSAPRAVATVSPRVDPELLAGDPLMPVTAYVVLEGEPLVSAAGTEERAGRPAAQARLAAIRARQAQLRPALESLDATIVGSFARLANAFQVTVLPDRLAELAALPGVARIERVGRYVTATSSSVPFVGAPEVWRRAGGGDGAGVDIGIIDTGIDYTHADFGGAGDAAAYANDDHAVVEPGTFPTAKVAGGWDFAGDAYDGGVFGGIPKPPVPDPDPIDCSGHGTHVAGVAAGGGVTAEGAAYGGPFDLPLDPAGFRIGPGVAPAARLYALKVFGCRGATALLASALEWAGDPDGDGDTADHLDVVNISLACVQYCGSEVERGMVDALGELGVYVAAAAGDDGGAYFSLGGPAGADRATQVAASIDDGVELFGIRIESPAAIAGTIPAAHGHDGSELQPSAAIAGALVRPEPGNACAPPTNGAALAGAVALIEPGGCEATVKIDWVQAAHAAAAVLIDDDAELEVVEYVYGVGGTLPAVRVRASDGARLVEHLGGGVQVALGPDLTATWTHAGGRLSSSSSRGPRLSDAALKPDLAAPGLGVTSADAGTGSQGVALGGTSIAAAHVAGAAAVLRQARPELTVDEIKAAMMNTAAPTTDGTVYPQSLAGAGTLRLDRAAAAPVTAVGDGPAGAVALSFGVVHAAARKTVERSITLTNHGASPVRYLASARATLARQGVLVSLPATPVTVPPQGSAAVPVRLEIDPARLGPVDDPTARDFSELSDLYPIGRHRLPEVSGDVVFADEHGAEAIHVPYHALVTASARLDAATPRVCVGTGGIGPGGDPGEITIPVTGLSAHPHPVVTALELGAESPDLELANPADAAADLIAVGAASDYPATNNRSLSTLYFGLATAGEWVAPIPEQVRALVEIDFGYVGGVPALGRAWAADETFFSELGGFGVVGPALVTEFRGPKNEPLDGLRPLNFVPAPAMDTAPFANSVMLFAVSADVWPFDNAFEQGGGVRYRVSTISRTGFRDETPWIDFDPRAPAIASANGTAGPLHLDRAPILATLRNGVLPSSAPRVLLLSHMNLPGERVRIVDLDLASQGTDLRLTGAGDPVVLLPERRVTQTFTLTNGGKAAAAEVTFRGALSDGARYLSAAPTQGECDVAAQELTCTLASLPAAGSATITVVIEGLAAGSFAHAAAASAAGCESVPEDNVAEVAFEVRHGVRRRLGR